MSVQDKPVACGNKTKTETIIDGQAPFQVLDLFRPPLVLSIFKDCVRNIWMGIELKQPIIEDSDESAEEVISPRYSFIRFSQREIKLFSIVPAIRQTRSRSSLPSSKWCI